MTEDEIIGWNHQLDGHEFEQNPGDVKDRESWYAAVCGVAESQIQLSDSTTSCPFTKYPAVC